MRNSSFLIRLFCVITLATTVFASCEQKKSPQTVNGKVIDKSANNITLLTEKGDTLHISTMDADPEKIPGVMQEDKVKISTITEKENGEDVLKAIELTVTEPGAYHKK